MVINAQTFPVGKYSEFWYRVRESICQIKKVYGASAGASHWLNISLPLYCLLLVINIVFGMLTEFDNIIWKRCFSLLFKLDICLFMCVFVYLLHLHGRPFHRVTLPGVQQEYKMMNVSKKSLQMIIYILLVSINWVMMVDLL